MMMSWRLAIAPGLTILFDVEDIGRSHELVLIRRFQDLFRRVEEDIGPVVKASEEPVDQSLCLFNVEI
jgi:hypothetical protein